MSHRENLTPTTSSSPHPPVKRAAKAVLRRGLYALLLVGILAAGLAGDGALGTTETASAQGSVYRDLYLDSGNVWPTGIWSDGSTMLVLNPLAYLGDGSVFEYDLTPGSSTAPVQHTLRDAEHFPLVQLEGIWSDGSTIWVIATHTFEGGCRTDTWNMFQTGAFTGDCHSVDGVEFGGTRAAVHAYSWPAGQPLPEYSFYLHHDEAGTYQAPTVPNPVTSYITGNSDPGGIWSDGSIVWILDETDKKLYAYTMPDGSSRFEYPLLTDWRLPGRDINLHPSNNNPGSISGDGSTIWVMDHRYSKMYAYDLLTGDHLPDLTFTTWDYNVPATGSGDCFWFDDSSLWMLGSSFGRWFIRGYDTTRIAGLSDVSVANVTAGQALATISLRQMPISGSNAEVHMRHRTAAADGAPPGAWTVAAPVTSFRGAAHHTLPELTPATRYEVQASLDESFPASNTRSTVFVSSADSVIFDDITLARGKRPSPWDMVGRRDHVG